MKNKIGKKVIAFIMVMILCMQNIVIVSANQDVLLGNDKDGNIDEGEKFELSVNLPLRQSEYEYCFKEQYEEEETVVQDFSESNTYEAELEGLGVHKFLIEVRDNVSGELIDIGEAEYEVTVNEKQPALPGQEPKQDLNQESEVQEDSENVEEEKNIEGEQTSGTVVDSPNIIREDKDTTNTIVQEKQVFDAERAAAISLQVTSNKSASEKAGTEITLNAKAAGGSGSYEYRYTETYNGQVTTVRAYSSDPKYTFKAKGVGVHRYTVAAKDASGSATSVNYTLTVLKGDAISLQVESNKSASEKAGTEITLNAKAAGGDGSYEYRYTETYNGQVTTVRAYSSDPKYTFKAKGVGVHRYTVAARDASGSATSVNYTLTVLKGDAISLQVESNKSASEKAGTEITLNAKAAGGDGSYEYRYTETYNGQVTTVKAYSSDPKYTFKAKGVGVHRYTVAAKDASGSATSVNYTLTVLKGDAISLQVESNKSASEKAGTEITLNAKAAGGDGSYEYRYTETYNGQVTTVRAYSSDPKYTFKAKGVGVHRYTVAAKDASGSATSVNYTLTVLKGDAISLQVESNKSASEKAGTEITLNAKAAGGDGSYEYRYTETYNGQVTTVKAYSSDPKYTFKAKGVGVHRYTVAVKDASGSATSVNYTLTVLKGDAISLQVESNKSASEKAGTEITLNAKAAGGDGSYEYRYTETYNGQVTTVKAYSSDPKYTFKAKGVGVHTYTVAAKDASGSATSVNYTLTVLSGEVLGLKVTSNRGTSVPVGTTVTLTSQATGGDGQYSYRYTEEYNGKVTTVRGYDRDPNYTFTASGVGVHKYTIAVIDSSSGSYSVTYTHTISAEKGKELKGTVSANVSGSVAGGEKIVLTAQAENGYGDYQYRFTEVYNGVSTTVQAYSTKNTYQFTAKGLGTHKFTVAIKDKQNQTTSTTYSVYVQNFLPSENIGIDVSVYQGKIDWARVKQSGVQFAMLRVVSGKMGDLEPDGQFYNNIQGAKSNGIKVGAYRYGYAMTVEEARQEANMVVQTLKKGGYSLDYPVAYDVEGAEQATLSKAELTAVISEFKRVIEANGYRFMIYANLDWLQNKIDMNKFSQEEVWIARYRAQNLGHGYKGPGKVTIWQYTSSGSVPGISGNVDMNVGY